MRIEVDTESLKPITVILTEILKILKGIKEQSQKICNIHNTISFSTAGTTVFRYDAAELLGLPKGYYITDLTIIDNGGGFTFIINGETVQITAIDNMTLTNEKIHKIEITPAGVAGTGIIRVGGYIENV